MGHEERETLEAGRNMRNFIANLFVFLAVLSFSGRVFAQSNFTYPQSNYVKTVRGMDFYSSRSKDRFANALASEYKSLALFKANFTNNVPSANHFAAKALAAYHGERVKPDNVYARTIPEFAIIDLSNGYDDLLSILATDIKNEYPALMAEAQSKFDCWAESLEEGRSTRQVATCRDRFYRARKELLEKIDTTCSKCKVELAAAKEDKKLKEFDGTLLPLPKWPNIPLIANNPPKPAVMRQATTVNDIDEKDIADIKASIRRLEQMIAGGAKAGGATVPAGDTDDLKEMLSQIRSEVDLLKGSGGVTVVSRGQGIGQEQIDRMEDQLGLISEQLNEISERQHLPECEDCVVAEDGEVIFGESEDEGFEMIDEGDYMEVEVFDRPSDLLPFEIFFDWNKDGVDYKFLPQLADIVEKALASKESIIVQGHTDTSGMPEYNRGLSNRRALNVAKILEKNGIEKSKIIIQAMGATELKIPTPDGVKKPENRRVVIK
jgi:outer membrane protein OmpA-like peptidoglycan-associated protein